MLLFTSVTDLLLPATIIVCLLLALATAALMWLRTGPRDDSGQRRKPPFDAVLLASAVAVIIMAGIAWYSL